MLYRRLSCRGFARPWTEESSFSQLNLSRSFTTGNTSVGGGVVFTLLRVRLHMLGRSQKDIGCGLFIAARLTRVVLRLSIIV